MAKIWHIYQFINGEPSGWNREVKADNHIFNVTDAQKSESAKVQTVGWSLVFESDELVVKTHTSGLTQIWVPVEKGDA